MSFWLQSDQSWHLWPVRVDSIPDLQSCTSSVSLLQCSLVFFWQTLSLCVIILIRHCGKTSCHSRHPSYGVTAWSFEVLLLKSANLMGSEHLAASCTASVQESLYLRHSQQKPQRCHPLHSRLSVIHPHKTCGGTTGNTNTILEWFYLSKQFRDEIKLQTTWQARRSQDEPRYYGTPWNH